jgi:hypothetical protein
MKDIFHIAFKIFVAKIKRIAKALEIEIDHPGEGQFC